MSARFLVKSLTLGLLLVAVSAQGQQMYRWTDAEGRVHYSDQPPPKDAKNVQAKNLGANIVETDALPYATQVARRRNPVTLYVFDCGDVCSQARNLLRSRGVPFNEVDTRQQANLEKLKALTGGTDVPVLVVGDTVVNGYETGRWQTALDAGGYPSAVTPRQAGVAAKAAGASAAPVPAPAPAAGGGSAGGGTAGGESPPPQKVPTVGS
ncbi:hypothetical protein BURK2_02121 [Burkholderiales bacterium]|nr:hypothetical protein BURK2_02121 [Burkholderiales bacterium]